MSKQKQKGITLIALVITIIVLLILAGVTLNTLFSENGIIGRAQDAKVTMDKAQILEQLKLEVAGNYDKNLDLNPTTLAASIRSDIEGAIVYGTNFPLAVTVKGYGYQIDSNGNVTQVSDINAAIETAQVSGVVTITSSPAQTEQANGSVTITLTHSNIPTGYKLQYNLNGGGWTDYPTGGLTVSENGTIVGRLYSEKLQTGVGESTSFAINNIVSGSPTVYAAPTTAVATNTIYDDGTHEALIPEGFYVLSSATTIANGLVVAAPDGSEFVWVPIDKATLKPIARDGSLVNMPMAENIGTEVAPQWRGKLYEFGAWNSSWTAWEPYSTPQAITYSASGYREPDTLSLFDVDTQTYLSAIGRNASGFATELQDEYDDMIESIQKYGGFYVGRYETSLVTVSGSKVAQSKGGSSANVMPATADTSSADGWYGLYDKQKRYAGTDTETVKHTIQSTSVASTMITGACYDAMLNWALNSGNDSARVTTTGYGNHNNSSAVACGTYNVSSTYDKINNIYDLEGNCYEWTSEAYNNHDRVFRGRLLPK